MKNGVTHKCFNWKMLLTIVFGIVVFCWWGLMKPHVLSYQEQYQLFVWTFDYLAERLTVAGGMADWLGEFVTQFYYIPWLGGCLLALLYMLFQRLFATCLSHDAYLLSFIPPVLLFWFMGDLNVLVSYPIAIIIVLLLVIIHIKGKWSSLLFELSVVPVAYWLIGPMVWLYVGLRLISDYKRNFWIPLWLCTVQLALWYTILEQWPLQSVMLSMGYYRNPTIQPLLWIIPLTVLCLVLLDKPYIINKVMKMPVQAVCVLLLGWLGYSHGYDAGYEELVWQDYQIRNEKWDDIIKRAENRTVESAFWSNSVNLALAEKRQLADRMFDFYQSGTNALLMNSVRNSFSNLPTAEAFYRLGMINSAQRYMFDMQESINNVKKSGRFTKRIAECYIINGKYDLARKHLHLLKNSLFYSSWAKDAEQYLGQEEKINSHPVWGRLRQLRTKEEGLYSYQQMSPILGGLFLANKSNTMALDYFVGMLLLYGDAPKFQQVLPWVEKYGGYSQMPKGYQDALICAQRQGNVPGSPYAAFIRRMLAEVQKQENSNAYETAH